MIIKSNSNTLTKPAVVLLCADETPAAQKIERVLTRKNYEVRAVSTNDIRKTSSFDLVILTVAQLRQNLNLPGECALESRSVLVLHNRDDKDFEPVRHVTYLFAPFSEIECEQAVESALRRTRIEAELWKLREGVAMTCGFDNIVGISSEISQLKDAASRLAPTDISLLIQGPSGSGKQLLARCIHLHSEHRNGRFVTVDLAAIPDMLIENDLFGSVATEAIATVTETADSRSLIRQAEGGTLFLKNIDQASNRIQPRLAQFLRTMTLDDRPGDSGKLNLRIISSSRTDISTLVVEDRFDQRLFDLISVIPINLPSLVDRAEDIEMLTDYFLRRMAKEIDHQYPGISRDAVDRLLRHTWPGNVRELENCLRRALTLCQGNILEHNDITFLAPPDGERETPLVAQVEQLGPNRKRLLDDSQKSIIHRALDENNWNYTQTAQELGIGRTTLWRKVKKYRLKRSASKETGHKRGEEIYVQN